MQFEHLLYDVTEQVAVITLNRPDRYNAMNELMRQELLASIRHADQSDDVRAIVITGAGKAFCSGGDMQDKAKARENQDSDDNQAKPGIIMERTTPMRDKIILAMRESDKPLIAAVNGVAAGGGMTLALACDIRIGSSKARFSQSFTRRGMHPDSGSTYFLPRLVGMAAACDMIWSGRMVEAEESLKLGIVSRITEPEELLPATLEMAKSYTTGAPIAIRLAKTSLYRNLDASLQDAMQYENFAQSICRETDDIKEGIMAFMEKREPKFTGR